MASANPAGGASEPSIRSGRGDGARTPPLVAIAMLSAAALGYEVLLARLFSIIQWHHFASMVISVALLGYGAAATFVAVARHRLLERYAQAFVAGAAAFGAFAVAGFALAQRVRFNPLELAWDPSQWLHLLAVYALLLVPFFCVACPLCLSYARFGARSHRVYASDILGGGVGCLAILLVLFAVTPTVALELTGALGLAAAAAADFHFAKRLRASGAALAAGAIALPLAIPASWTRLDPSEFKDLAQALQIAGARIVAERSSPLGVITLVESPQVPFRHAPGLSLNAPSEPPPQLGVFVDGDGPSALLRNDGRPETLSYLDYVTSALPYHLLTRPRVLVLGAGSGADVLQALALGARSVDAVEQNRQLIDLVEGPFGEYSGQPYSVARVRTHVAEARGFVGRDERRFDLIEIALLDAFGVSAAGLHALSESYLYTIEGITTYLDRLEPGGMLAITRWVNLPPRDMFKLVATVSEALERRGVEDPTRRVALIRSWKTATLIVKNGGITPAEIAALRAFCRSRSFDADYYPGISPDEANRYNVLDASYFHDGVVALLGPERAGFVERYKFAIAPATDDRPYFFHFFRWATLPEWLALKGQGGLPLLEWGYPVLIATLIQLTIASVVLVSLPLWFDRRWGREAEAARPPRLAVTAYFASIGLAFMFIEIAFIQKFVLFLAQPLYAVAVVLCAFLVFAGLGSRYSPRVTTNGVRHPLPWITAVIAGISLGYLIALPVVFGLLLPQPDLARIAVSIALIAPLAFAMGMPFPLALVRLASRADATIPWAWGINANASVIGAVLATLLAIHLGFAIVVMLAVALYGVATLAWPALCR